MVEMTTIKLFCPLCNQEIRGAEKVIGWTDVEWVYFKCKSCNLDGSYRVRRSKDEKNNYNDSNKG